MNQLVSIPKIILDTDPGGDDAFALLWLQSLAQQGLAEILAVTTTAGNVSAQQTFTAASQLLGLGGFSTVEVGRGATLVEQAADAAHIHGADGMGNLSQTLDAATHDYHTARFSDDLLIDKLQAFPGEVTIVAIGPLTNLAAAETKHPGILRQAKQIVLMGGAFLTFGNVTPLAEFNIHFNPTAAQIVLHSRDDLVVLPLDVTRHLVFTEAMIQTLQFPKRESKIARFLTDLGQFMIGTALAYRETQGQRGFLVHDAATLGYLFYPETFLFRRAQVDVEMVGQFTRGQTICDRRSQAKLGANAWVAVQVDEALFFANLIEDLKYLIFSK